ncbi:hypothetical protein [Pseudomonas sp. H1_G08]
MSTIILALICAFAVILYWVSCRNASLKHQEKVAELLEKYFEDHKVSEDDRDSAYWTYRFARLWIFMPAMTLVAPVWLALSILIRGAGHVPRKPSAQHSEIIDSIVKMYVTKNPLTSLVCMPVFLFSVAVLSIIGLVTNRMKAIPTLASLYSSVAHTASHASREVKSH